jgi:TonB family protein
MLRAKRGKRGMKIPSGRVLVCCAALLGVPGTLGTAPAAARAAAAAEAPERPAIEEGARLLGRREYSAAVEAFKHADELAGGHCGVCLLGLARALQGLERYELAIGVARGAIEALGDAPLAAKAQLELGGLLLARHGQGDVEEAERAFTWVTQNGKVQADRAAALSGLAVVHLRQKRFPEAVQAAREVLRADAQGPVGRQARVALCLARERGPVPGPAASSSDSPKRVGGAVQKPEKLYAPGPSYSDDARRAKIQGKVILEAIIDSEGCVTDPHVLKGLDRELDRKTLDTVKDWVFEPARLEGVPVKVYYTLTITFAIQAETPH